MKLPFREHHLMQLLNGYQQQSLPLDLFVNHYFRANLALGSKDRGYIAETVYALIRWKGLLDHLCGESASWEERLGRFQHPSFTDAKQDVTIPAHIRISFPQVLFERILASYGEQKTLEICSILNQSAPTTVRINPLKTTRETMLKRWQSLYEVSPCARSEYGILFHKKLNFFSLAEFQEGLFEVQDEGSQLLGQLVKAEPKQRVLDYCAGSGGKTLTFAPNMQGTGQIYLHDIRLHTLHEARKRLKRAGIQNAQILPDTDTVKLKKLKKQMDWVLVDAPCTGTGTLRRNPDMKWRYEDAMLQQLVSQQRVIFEKALSFMKPDGRIVYATCSLLQEENQKQVEHFIKTYNLVVEGEPFSTLPVAGGMDGFFGVVLRHKS